MQAVLASVNSADPEDLALWEQSADNTQYVFNHYPKISVSGPVNEADSDLIAKGRLLVENYTESLGADHPKTLWAEFGLGRALLLNEQYEEAREVLSDVLTRQHSIFPEDSSEVLKTQWHLASVLLVLGKYSDSCTLLEHVVEVASDRTADDEFPLSHALPDLGRALSFLGRFSEEVPIRRRVLLAVMNTPRASDLQVLEARTNLAAALRATGDSEEAAELDSQNLRELADIPESRAVFLTTQYNRGLDLIKVGKREEGEREVFTAYQAIVSELSPEDPLRREVEPRAREMKRIGKRLKRSG
jgi:tetratricopeptide (TPR) repeat protein